jgi:hypothetical protein
MYIAPPCDANPLLLKILSEITREKISSMKITPPVVVFVTEIFVKLTPVRVKFEVLDPLI